MKTALSEMLTSDGYTVQLAALMAVSGRSPGELIKSGTFKVSNEPFTLTFSPTGLGAKSTLKTLISADVVVEFVQKLRQHPDLQELLYQTPSFIDHHCQPYINQAIHAHLPFDDLDAMIDFYRQTTRNYTVKSDPEPSLVSDEDQNRLIEIAKQLNLEGEPSKILHGLLKWAGKQLRSLPSTEQNNDPLDSKKSRPRVIFGSQEMMTETIHHQAQTIALLTQQLALGNPNPTETPQPNHPTDNEDYQREIQERQQQLSQLQQQNDSLSQQITQLKARVYDFEQENQHLKQTVSRFEVIKQAVLGEQLELPIDTDTTPNKTPQKTKTKTKGKTQGGKTRKTRGPRGAAKVKAKKVLDAVTQWNQEHPDQTWAINTCLLETSFGIYRQVAVEFQEEHKSQIEQLHRHSHVSNPQTHNRKKNLAQLKAFVQPFLED